MHGNPDADVLRDIVQLLRERIEQGLLTIFIKIKAHRADPLNELADNGQMKGDKPKIFVGLCQRTDPSSTGLTTAQRTVAP